MSLPQNVKISDKVLFQEIDGESVLLNLNNEQYFGLNEVGTRIWQLFSENSKTANALTILQNEFNVDNDTLQKDLAVLINELNLKGLIEIED